jgi:hypothetical protein
MNLYGNKLLCERVAGFCYESALRQYDKERK